MAEEMRSCRSGAFSVEEPGELRGKKAHDGKKLSVLLLAAALCFLLAGCAGAKKPVQSEAAPVQSEVAPAQSEAAPESVSATGSSSEQEAQETGETQTSSEPEEDPLPAGSAEVTACYPDKQWHDSHPEYEEALLDFTKYAVAVAVETTEPITEFQVVSLEVTDYTEQGLVCSTEELYSLPELTPEKPILIALAFPGDLPAYGVRFVDALGTQRLFTFSQSGMDGSLIFEEAELAHGE